MTRLTWLLATLGLLLAAPAALAADCDVNGDGAVDSGDQEAIRASINQTDDGSGDLAGDFDGDGVISLVDLADFMDTCDAQ